MLRSRLLRVRWLAIGGIAFHVGCAARSVDLPVSHLPPPPAPMDLQTANALAPKPAAAPVKPPEPDAAPPKKDVFGVPPSLPGATSPPVQMPKFAPGASPADRIRAVREAYPTLSPVKSLQPADGVASVSLSDLEALALANSPTIKRASDDVAVSYGQVIQAGLHPNPTVGYQADQVQPYLPIPPGATFSGAGQQGGYINQLIKTAGKLTLAQKVSGFDYINALVAVRAAQVSVTTQVRTAYFTALVARRNADITKAIAEMIDEVYDLQLKRVAAGVDAGYEPLQIYAQAVQVRNAHAQAEATARAAWKQLAAAVGQPDLPQTPLAGRADAPAPAIDEEAAKARILEQHTDILTARNTLAQGQTNLLLQKRMPIPDIQTNQYHQHDNATSTYQFGLQLGIALPIFDRNQGNIRAAQSRIFSNAHSIEATRNDLLGRFAEAYGRYRANSLAAANYRDKILPSLTQAYRALVQRYQVEPDKVAFGDIVVAQQNLVQAMQAYLAALDAQWRAVVDVANITQAEELFGVPAPAK